MAASKKKKPTIKKKKSSILKDDRIKRILGLVLLLIAFLLLVSFTSGLFHGNADQAITNQTLSTDFDEEVLIPETNNALGLFGALMTKLFVKNMFGVAAYGIVIILFAAGLNLMLDKKIFRIRNLTYHSIFLMFLIASFLEFFRAIFFASK